MPNVFDRAKPFVDFDPLLNKLNFDIGDWQQKIEDAALQMFLNFIHGIFEAIEEATGVELDSWIAAVDAVIFALIEIFGELNPFDEDFDPAAALMTMFNLAVTLATLSPGMLTALQQLATTGLAHLLLGFAVSPGAGSIIEQLIIAMGGAGNTLADINAIFIVFNNAMTSLGILFGELNIFSGSFDPADALTAFLNLIATLIAGAPTLLTALQDLITYGITNVVSLDTWTAFIGDFIIAIGGTGSTVAHLLTALGQIPAGNILGALANATITAGQILGVLDEALIPALTGGWSGTIASSLLNGFISDTVIPSLTGAWSGSIASSVLSGLLSQTLIPSLTGAWAGTIDGSLLSGLLTETVIPALTGAWAGTIDGSLLSGLLSETVIPALTGAWTGTIAGSLLSGYTTIEQEIIDAVNAALGQATGGLSSTIYDALLQIPPTNVLGQWSTTLNSDLAQLLTAATQGVAGTGIPAGINNLQTALSGLTTQLGYLFSGGPPANSTTGITTTNNEFINKRAASKPSFFAIDPSADAVFALTQMSGASPTTISVTQANSAIGMVGTPDGGVAGTDTANWPLKKSIAFLGSGPTTTTITGMYINIYRVNTATGATTLVHTSTNLITAGVSPTLAWNYYNIPNAIDYIPVGQGEWYAVELTVFGTGTYSLVGVGSSWMPAHPTVFPKSIGATRANAEYKAVIANTAGNGGNNNSKSGTGTIDITLTLDAGVTCVVVFASTAQASGTPTFSVSMDPAGANQAFTDVRSNTVSGNSKLRSWVWFNTSGLTGSKTIRLSQTAGGVGTWNASMSAQSFIGPTSVGTHTTASATGTGPGITSVNGVANGFTAVGIAGNQVMSGATNWNNVAGGNLNVGGTFPMISGYAQGFVGSIFYSTTMSPSAAWAAILIPLIVAPKATYPTFNAIGGASPAYSSNVPWFAMCGSAGLSQHPPDLQTFTASGTYTKPLWANYFDIIVFGAGGGGVGGAGFAGGANGNAGAISSVTYSAATVAAASTFAVTVGAGGGPGPSAGSAGNGGTSSVSGTGFTTVSAGGGAGGVGVVGSIYGQPAPGPGNTTVNGETYYGGGGGASGQASGAQPGGGGAGGNATIAVGSFVGGGGGGAGAVYILAYQ